MHVEEKKPWLVLSPTAYGIFAWRVIIDVKTRAVDLSPSITESTWLVVRDPKQWKCAELVAKPPLPTGGSEKSQMGSRNLSLICGADNGPLLHHAAKKGFRHLNVPQLRELASAIGLQGHKRSSEAVLIESVSKEILGARFTPEVQSKALAARGVKEDSHVHVDAAVLAQDAETVLDNEWLDHDECRQAWRDLLEEQARHREKRKPDEAVSAKATTEEEKTSKKQKHRSEASSSSGATTMGTRHFNPLPVKGLDAASAQLLAPPGCKVRKDTTENRYTLVSAHIANKSHTASRSYGEKSGRSENRAIRELLMEAWRSEYRVSGVECNHDLVSLLPD
eukprot:3516604-Amphidinium_carterae.1